MTVLPLHAAHHRRAHRPRRTATLVLATVVALIAGTFGVVSAGAAETTSLQVSAAADRSAPVALNGATLSGNRYVFVTPEAAVQKVDFFLDNTAATGTPTKSEGRGPFDFAGTGATVAVALPWNTSVLPDGPHTVTVRVTLKTAAVELYTAAFTIANAAPTTPGLVAAPGSIGVSVPQGSAATDREVAVSSSTGAPFTATVTGSAPWVALSILADGPSAARLRAVINPAGLAAGTYSASAVVSAPGHTAVTIPITLTVTAAGGGGFALQVSPAANRSGATPLAGVSLSGDRFVFLTPEAGVTSVSFYLDNPAATGTPARVENGAPFDFKGGTAAAALRWDTSTVPDGPHTITAKVTHAGGTVTVTSTFGIANSAPRLQATPTALALGAPTTGPSATGSVTVSSSNGSAITPNITSSQPWLTATAAGAGASRTVTMTANPAGLPTGAVDGALTISSPGLADIFVVVTFTVTQPGATGPQLRWGTTTTRANPQPLDQAVLTGNVFPFVTPSGVTSVSFWIDDPSMTTPVYRVDNSTPFDLGGSNPNGTAKPWNSAQLPDGPHTLTARVTTTAGQSVVQAAFRTANNTNSFTFSPDRMTVEANQGSLPQTFQSILTSTAPATATITSDASWLSVGGGSTFATPRTLDVTVDPGTLSQGTYTATLSAMANGVFTGKLTINVVVGGDSGCAPVACSLIKVPTPFTLNWLYDSGNLLDRRGDGTGFTYVLNGRGPGSGVYDRSKLSVDTQASTLTIDTTSGGFTEGNQDNALGVGFNGPLLNTTIAATLAGVPTTTTGQYEQAGLWFGYSQDNLARVSIQDTPTGWRMEYTVTVAGVVKYKRTRLVDPIDGPVKFYFLTNPVNRTTTAAYQLAAGGTSTLGTANVPGEFFSFDAAGLDPRIGTRSFTGIYGSDRSGPPTKFVFDDFGISSATPGGDTAGFGFNRVSYDSQFPTSMVFGPDGKLYTTDLFGRVHRMTIGPDHTVVGDETFSVLGSRLALGITVDPASTPGNVILYVAHSSPITDHGVVDTGMITRLSGPNLSIREDVVTGLPRSYANHGPNSLHFGPDGKLYLASGGNTGAGSGNTAGSEFGERGEQELSAALVVADIDRPGFDGSCQNLADMYAPAPCDVEVFASGLRNTYDFTHHSNGLVYGVDNGLGVVGTYPPQPTAPCSGFGDPTSWTVGGDNPGTQNDELNLIEQGFNYGHPNPARDECVFKDGSYQGVSAPANYRAAFFDTGTNRSSNGIIEYSGQAFCGDLDKNLVYGNYSVGDNLVRVELSADGRSVVSSQSIVEGLNDPLPITLQPDGTIWVGEFGSGQITALVPKVTGCWATESVLPTQILDAGGAGIGDKLYVVGGKNSQHRDSLYIYDTLTDTWSSGPALPGGGVENPATAVLDGRLYVFGGSTAAFSGASGNAAVYDPGTNAWTSLPAMPVARGGATAQVDNGAIYVIGGLGADGASLATTSVFTPGPGTWTSGPTMATARDNPASAVLDGTVYVFGGRTRLANGSVTAELLTSVETLSSGASAWSAGVALPTGRRTAAAAALGGRILVLGGEVRADGLAFDTVEVFDPATGAWTTERSLPSGRHGMAAGVAGGVLHLVGGGAVGGFATSDAHYVYVPHQ